MTVTVAGSRALVAAAKAESGPKRRPQLELAIQQTLSFTVQLWCSDTILCRFSLSVQNKGAKTETPAQMDSYDTPGRNEAMRNQNRDYSTVFTT